MPSGLYYCNSLDKPISNSRVPGYVLILLCFIEIPVLYLIQCRPRSDAAFRSAAFDLGLDCLSITFCEVSRLK